MKTEAVNCEKLLNQCQQTLLAK